MFISIGKIVNTHGVRGEVRAVVYSDDPRRLEREESIWAVSPVLAEKISG